MAQALLSAIGIGLVGLVAAAVFGLRGTDVGRHISFGFFSTMVMMLAHSMMMFYLIGKGKAVKDAMAEHNVAGDYFRRIAAARKPVFSIGTLAMAVTMVAAIIGASVDTGVLPAIDSRDDRLRRDCLQPGGGEDRNRRAHRIGARRRRSESPDRLVTSPVLELTNTVKDYRGLRPLRIEQLEVGCERARRVHWAGPAHGRSVREPRHRRVRCRMRGEVRSSDARRSTIADSAEWLAVVDRFGIVSRRAVLLEAFTLLQNLAVPLTLDIESIAC